MNKINEIAELFAKEISEVCRLAQRTETEQWSDSATLADVAVVLPTRRRLTAAKLEDGGVAELTYYDPNAAAAFLISLIGGVVGATNLVVVMCAVIGCLLSLKGLARRASRAEGIAFLTVYESPQKVATRQQAELRFSELVMQETGVVPEDFPAALQGLLDLHIIEESRGRLVIAERVVAF